MSANPHNPPDQISAESPGVGHRGVDEPAVREAPPGREHDRPAQPPAAAVARAKAPAWRKWMYAVAAVILLVVGLTFGVPWVHRAMTTVATDDAYVNSHVTFVAPRVGGQVARVVVEDNNRVRKGDLLVQLDREPYQVQVNIADAAVAAAQADLINAQAQARAIEAQMRALRFNLTHAIESVDNQVALLHSKVATLRSQQASLDRAQSDYNRAVGIQQSGAVSKEELDRRKEALLVAQAQVEEARQNVYQVRVSLGLPPQPAEGHDLTEVPADLNQNFSTVRQAQASLIQAAAQLGVTDSLTKTPQQMLTDFYKRDPSGDINVILEKLGKDAPAVKQADARLAQAKRNLDQAKLNLKYCDVTAEIDGVVTRRNVNPGNNVSAGQALMAVRSLKEIWIDANFKETQLANLRIGQPVDIDVDMYGRKQKFRGRISGFTMGTGSTLALLPAENATGNFVKVVQRLPVRIDLVDYDADKTPLFVGLSVTPRVLIKEQPSGPNAGAFLQRPLEPPEETPTEVRP